MKATKHFERPGTIVMMRTRNRSRIGWVLALVAYLAVPGLLSGRAAAQQQTGFPSADAAAEAFVAALEAGTREAFAPLLGEEHLNKIVGPPEIASDTRADMKRLLEAAREGYVIRGSADGPVSLVIGKEAWPLPIPIVQAGGAWRFDSAAGSEEIINRRIGRNELSAIAICRIYIDAQIEYASRDRDSDGVREYAQRLASNEGQKDGLYWPAGTSAADVDVSPLGPMIVEASDYLAGRKVGEAVRGYHYRILLRQNESALGGRYDYVINGNMIAGFALIATPAAYGETGIMTFMCSHHGSVYEQDLGDNTTLSAAAIRAFDPGDGWTLVND